MPDDAPTQACPKCGTLVDTAAVEPLASVTCPKCGEKFRAQRAFDHFALVETLGVGGMGSVYKARDTRLDRFVALKLLRKELSADPAEAARLEQEARLTAAVNHPHVIQVYSTGHAHDQIYLVMELVDHGSLDDLMAQHPRVPEADVLRAGIQVAKGLQAAHEKGLIHRDVKPANILFANAETAKIGDFGLAVTAGQHAEAAQEIWGTPYYVAPERLNNEPEDFRSDIYSLGATLFHALAGRPPIEGETTSASELRKLKNDPPHLRSIAPEISRPTARLIMRMIAPQPDQRFPSYAALIEALEQAASGNESDPAPAKRSRAPLIAVVGLLALGAVAFVVYFLQQKQTPPAVASSTPNTSTPAAKSPTTPPRDEAAERQRAQEKQAAEKAAAEEKIHEAERQKLFATETPAWQKALTEARAKIVVYDFPAALAAIDAAQVTEPSLVTARETERKKINWLIDWKKKLIDDLSTGHFRAPLKIGGIDYTGADKADETRITFRLPFGNAPLVWTKVPAQTLLAMSLSVFKPDAPDAAERNWLAAIFAHATGQADAARSLADKAAKAKPEYREQLPLLSAP